ncbi:MAG: NAD-dependent epimerase/dehydratase family protein [Bacteroidetes bacterium]|nr:NAD-dependent epimerase/dehydratase family protein [Bacteroidota bacterium]
MQTILGAGGAVGTELARELAAYTDVVRIVGRNPHRVNPSDELVSADLLNPAAVSAAVQGSDVVFLCVGLEYKLSVWEAQWPVVMRNVIDACAEHHAKLVFIDNVYVFGADSVAHITESTPPAPTSAKGALRLKLFRMIFDAVEAGRIQAIVARCADFYGPSGKNSMLYEMVVKNLVAKKQAMWLANADVKHSFTYAPDAAKGMAMLGNANDTYNAVWNLPTHAEALTVRTWERMIADALGVPSKGLRIIGPFLLTILGIFIPVLREMKEMTYQYDRDYVFDSSKFIARFAFTPTTPNEGIAAMITHARRAASSTQGG